MRLVLAEDNALLRVGLTQLLEGSGFVVAREAVNAVELDAALEDPDVDGVVLFDPTVASLARMFDAQEFRPDWDGTASAQQVEQVVDELDRLHTQADILAEDWAVAEDDLRRLDQEVIEADIVATTPPG